MNVINADFRLRIDHHADLDADDSPLDAPAETSDGTALRAFSRAAHGEPGDPDYDFILGLGLLRAGRPGEAIPRLRDAIRLERQNPEYHLALGFALWRLLRVEEAEQAFGASARLRPDPGTLNAHGATLVHLGRATEAVEVLRRALRTDARLASTHGNLGVALWHLDRRAEALRHLRRAARLGRHDVHALRNLAQAQLASGHAADALKPLRMIVACDPHLADAHLELGEGLFHAGRYAEAEDAFAQAASLDAMVFSGRPEATELRDALRLTRIRSQSSASEGGRRTRVDALLRALLGLADLLPARLRLPSGLVLLAVATVATLAGGRLASAHVRHYLLQDDIKVAARAPVREEARVRDRLDHAVRKRGMQDVLDTSRCSISTSGEWRRIRCDYAVHLQLLPFWQETLHLQIDVEEPFIVEPDRVHY